MHANTRGETQASSEGQVSDHGAQTAVLPLDQLPETNKQRGMNNAYKTKNTLCVLYFLLNVKQSAFTHAVEMALCSFCSPVSGDLNLQSHLYI